MIDERDIWTRANVNDNTYCTLHRGRISSPGLLNESSDGQHQMFVPSWRNLFSFLHGSIMEVVLPPWFHARKLLCDFVE